MRKSLSCLLTLALFTAGCGQAVPTGYGAERQATRFARQSADGPALARRFADAVETGYRGRVTVAGSVVTLADDDMLAIAYDFGAEPGMVRVTSEDFTTDMPLADVMRGAGEVQTEFLPVLLVPIATKMAIAGAKALAVYYLMHRGEEFDKSDAAKATVVAMSVAIIPFVGELGFVGQLVPVAGKLVATADTFAFKDLAKAAIGLLDEIVPILVGLIKRHRAEAAS